MLINRKLQENLIIFKSFIICEEHKLEIKINYTHKHIISLKEIIYLQSGFECHIVKCVCEKFFQYI